MMETFTTENHNQNLEFANSVREDRLQESLMKFFSTISATREIPWDLMDISVNIVDPEIDIKIMQDQQFKEILVNVVKKIKKYFHKKGMGYEMKILVWRDAEVDDWTENMIKVKTNYQDPDDRMKIWWDIQNLLNKKEKKTVTVLLED